MWLWLLGCGTSTAPRPPIPDPLPSHCPTPGEPRLLGSLAEGKLEETSGVVKSARHERLWLHNDSGGKPRVFAIGRDGSDLGRVRVAGAEAVDWEDIALIRSDERDFLLVGDIGDNKEKRESVQLYRFAEPRPGLDQEVAAERMDVRYPAGPKNAETLVVHPGTGDIYIVSKSKDGVSGLYRVGPFRPGAQVAAEIVGTRRFPPGYSSAKTTGGDISPDGRWLAVRTYTSIWLFPIGDTLDKAFTAEPCELRTLDEEQGESVTFVEGGLLTISEGEHAPVHFLPVSGL